MVWNGRWLLLVLFFFFCLLLLFVGLCFVLFCSSVQLIATDIHQIFLCLHIVKKWLCSFSETHWKMSHILTSKRFTTVSKNGNHTKSDSWIKCFVILEVKGIRSIWEQCKMWWWHLWGKSKIGYVLGERKWRVILQDKENHKEVREIGK